MRRTCVLILCAVPYRCADVQQVTLLSFFVFFFFGAGIEPRASRMRGKHCTTELHPSPVMLLEIALKSSPYAFRLLL
jgi:hypothetical protein